MARKTRALTVRRAPRTVYVRSSNGLRKTKFTIPLAVVAGFAPGIISTWQYAMTPWEGPSGAARHFIGIYTGWDTAGNNFDWHRLKGGLFPAVAGIAAHKLIGQRLGVNRMLARMGVPIVRI